MKPKLEAGKDLKIIMRSLTRTNEKNFSKKIDERKSTMKYCLSLVLILFIFNGCIPKGHQGFVDTTNETIGLKASDIKPFTFDEIKKTGVTHVTKDKEGNLIVHWNNGEVLPHFGRKEWAGKCLIYQVVDPKTHIIKGWGFDKGGNPQSCRIWR